MCDAIVRNEACKLQADPLQKAKAITENIFGQTSTPYTDTSEKYKLSPDSARETFRELERYMCILHVKASALDCQADFLEDVVTALHAR